MHIPRWLAAPVVAAGVLLAGAGAASADDSTPKLDIVGSNVGWFEGITIFGGTWYGVDATDVCRSQYPGSYVVAGTLNRYDPASLQCWTPETVSSERDQSISVGSSGVDATVSQSGSVTYRLVGGMDIYTWCNQKHPGTGSTSVFGDATSWACIR